MRYRKVSITQEELDYNRQMKDAVKNKREKSVNDSNDLLELIEF